MIKWLTGRCQNQEKQAKKSVLSLIETFTPEQVKEHIDSLRRCVGKSKDKPETSCQLCKVEALYFGPPPRHCSPCGAAIKLNAPYYTVAASHTYYCFCIRCYNESPGETIPVDSLLFLKTRLEGKINNEKNEEWWVQCDKCERWQHQICALFNGRTNHGGQEKYTCPYCYVQEVESGLRKPLPQSSVLGAKDLPRTVLSDHLEDRLFKRLKQERQNRASVAGQSFEEVTGPEDLVVRVVASVDKKLEVKPCFLETFEKDNYPTEFPYKSKAIFLFQKIEGVEVWLFGMYVQEFGADCSLPNQRRVYLSCLDYAKYFKPEIKTVSGEDLSTFVCHEILNDSSLLYFLTPAIDHFSLTHRYLSMLQKATEEEIVVGLTNIYDHFFITTGECKAKVTATRLPYFDGDYWSRAAEDMIIQLRHEHVRNNIKCTTDNVTTKGGLNVTGHTDIIGNTSMDAMLMQKLGKAIYPMKKDFIIVHLQYSCSHCCILMVSGKRWVCHQCRDFFICDKCYNSEQLFEERERHTSGSRHTHTLQPVDIVGLTDDTLDRDGILQSDFFHTSREFLNLCHGNHYQYDPLRHAKHSSMMVLYHLHNPTPEPVTTCSFCRRCDSEFGQGLKCQVCPGFDVCMACYLNGATAHLHKLLNHPSIVDQDVQNMEALQLLVVHELWQMLDLVVHVSKCRFGSCQYPDCQKFQGLFDHAMQCQTQASGGCAHCKKIWHMLDLHFRACKDSDCKVPRCRMNNNSDLRSFSSKEIEYITNGYSTSIGKGAFGEVYKGALDDRRLVAVKKFKDGTMKEEFAKELIVHSQINHKNVVRLLGYCTEENNLMIIMEFICNGNLDSILHSRNANGHAPFPLDKRLDIAIVLAEVLSYTHSMYSPVLHGDIKPANILLDENLVPKLSDFGIARFLSTNEAHQTNTIVGSFGYLDPLFIQSGILTVKSDVYSFGVVLVEMITRKKAADGSNNLIQNFNNFIKRGKRVRPIFDKEIAVGKRNMKLLEDIAKLAAECLRLEDKLRPEMVEVADILRKCRKDLHLCRSRERDVSSVCLNSPGSNLLHVESPVPISVDPTSKSPSSPVLNISLAELREITRNFSHDNLIGEGSYAKVFFGELKDGRKAAVKKVGQNPVVREFDGFFSEPDKEFILQIQDVSRLKHDNVIQLLGYCVEGNVRALIYEYSSRGSLHDILYGKKGSTGMQAGSHLSWSQRVKIAISAAEGIEFLHQAEPSVVHSDIKSSNILLFDNDVAKIGDLRVSKNRPGFLDDILLDCPCLRRHSGYDAPEYGTKYPVFCIPSTELGRRHARRLSMYPMLGGKYNSKAAAKMAEIASCCLESKADSRPSMSIVVNDLRFLLQNTPSKPWHW
ncbi:hypothetical protein EJB05_30842 [Eragrostis curvula]|uniref:histone acetyltransferase n=1 Tax=Eragrostis curvula TaxID=38414 RepID=A0A5J9UD05_9POAL|nr:hypothetical protein EJB05_30842 [Eragrostis curvula]